MRVVVILTARPSWAKLAPVCAALRNRSGVELTIIACASALLERYGNVAAIVKAEGYQVEECWSTYEGANLVTGAKETGALLGEVGSTLHRLQPGVAVVCADRHEVLGAAQAASYLHVPTVHLQGGERSGSIDDRVRNAITQLADWHCVSTQNAQLRVYSLTGRADRVRLTGCPSIDLAKQAMEAQPVTAEELGGAGSFIEPQLPFVLVCQHPVTNEADRAYEQMWTTLEATARIVLPRLVLWPGEDAGADGTSKAIRAWIAAHPQLTTHTLRNLPPARFLRLLRQCAVLVGNSSAGIREASYLGVPVVNVGTRQWGRERGPNVMDVPHEVHAIAAATSRQRYYGTYKPSALYGDGRAGEKIADVCLEAAGVPCLTS